MTNKELLQAVEHRPWPLPDSRWKFYQEWNDVIFLHWQVDPEQLRRYVPAELALDLKDGNAWVSLVAFTMENVRPGFLPSFPPVSNFDEINIRTYVKAGEKAGVYFLSIEAGNRLSAWLARALSELPYRYSSMARTGRHYQSANAPFGDKFSIQFSRTGHSNSKTDLDAWLTERYALFQDAAAGINKFEIHHVEWPIEAIDIATLDVHYPRFAGLLKGPPSLAHYSEGVSVLAWDREKLATS